MVNRGVDGPDAGWYAGPGNGMRDEYAPPAEPAAQPPRRAGRHGRPGAPDSQSAAIPPRYASPPYGSSQNGSGGYGQPGYDPAGYGQPEYSRPEYSPAAPAPRSSSDPDGGRPGPYGAAEPRSAPDPYGAPGPYGPAAGYGASGAYGPADPYGPPAGPEAPETYSQPGARGADQSGAYGAASPYGPADPYSTGPFGTDPLSTDPLGTGPLSTDPLSTGPLSTGPLSTGPQGTGPGGSAPPSGRSGRHGRAGDSAPGTAQRPDAQGYDSGPYATTGAGPARPGTPDPYGPPDPYRAPAGYGSGQFPVPGERTGPLSRSGPQDFSVRPDQTGPLSRSGPQDSSVRADRSGPLPRAGAADWPDQSGPQYQAGAQFQQGAPYQTGPQDRTDPRAAAPAGRTGPHRAASPPDPGPSDLGWSDSGWSGSGLAAEPGLLGSPTGRGGRSDVFAPPPRPLPPTPHDDDSLPGRGRDPFGSQPDPFGSQPDPFGSQPDPYGSPGALPGLPPAAGPAGRSGPFRWEPPEEPGSGNPDETSTALWRNGRPVGPSGFAAAGFAAGPEDAPPGRLEAGHERADDPDRWDDQPGSGGSYGSYGADYGSGGPGGGEPGPDPEAEEPDWSTGERHPGFFRGFGDDENVDPPKRRHGRWIAPVISLVVIIAILGTVAGFLGRTYEARHANYTGAGTGTIDFVVRSGDTATTLAPALVKLGVIKSTDPFIAAAKESPNADALTPGTFGLHHHMNATLAWNLLVSPSSRIQTKVAIPEGLRAADMLKVLAKDTGKPLSQFQQAYADTAALGLPAYANGNPEGYLFPATYDFPPGTTPAQMLHAMVAEFSTQTSSIGLAAAAVQGHLTEAQVITAASLLEAEADPGDYAKVARVIDNRLNQKMPLQFDSTVLYALHLTGFNLSTAQLHVKSPYNTFLHTGLPPGPIDSPGLEAINAVLHPAKGDWTYFVTVDPKTGLTKFTNNFAQFQQWVTESDKNIADGK